jgi:phosphoglycerol geranylgeranyltransferase
VLPGATVIEHIVDTSLSPRHAIILDPPNQTPDVAACRAVASVRGGTHMILVGGSTGVTPSNTLATVVAIQSALAHQEQQARSAGDPAAAGWRVPVVLFPCGAQALSPQADATLFPMLLNTRNQRYLVGEPLRMAPLVRQYGVAPLPTAYLVCAPGGTVGRVADVDLIEPHDTQRVRDYVLTAACFGFRLIYLEAGSGAQTPAATELVKAAKEASGLPVVSSGGIRTPEAACAAAEAGADWVVTGSLVELIEDPTELTARLRDLIAALRPTGLPIRPYATP